MVEQVEYLRAQPQANALGDLRVFGKANIELSEPGTTSSIARQVPVGVSWRSRKCVGVELIGRNAIVPRTNWLTRDQIGTQLIDAQERRRQRNVEGKPAAHLHQAGELPSL